MPVHQIERQLHEGGYANRLGNDVPIYLAAVLEYVTAEVLQISGDISKQKKNRRIIPRHIMIAIRNDEELNTLLKDVIIPQAGVVRNINSFLLPTNN